jgi:hypothetical protein
VGQRGDDPEQPTVVRARPDGQSGASAETAEQREEHDHVGLLGITVPGRRDVGLGRSGDRERLTSRPPLGKADYNHFAIRK